MRRRKGTRDVARSVARPRCVRRAALEGMRQKGRRSSFDDLPKRLRARWPDPTPVRPTSQAKDLRQKIFLVARIFSV